MLTLYGCAGLAAHPADLALQGTPKQDANESNYP
jgi:hypothetical protein